MITTVLLDIDGTLLDSNAAHAQAWVEALHEFQFSVEFSRVKRLIGMGSDYLLPELIGITSESELGQSLSKRRGQIFRREYLSTLKPFKNSRELVERIVEEGHRIVVATSATQEDLRGLLKQIGIADLIDDATNADDVEKSKPSPDIVSEALKKVGASPHEAVLIGDTPYDIRAASHAGVRAIGFTCGGWAASDLDGALAIYKGPWDILNQFDHSVLVAQARPFSPANRLQNQTRA